jgi:hypothetical protein
MLQVRIISIYQDVESWVQTVHCPSSLYEPPWALEQQASRHHGHLLFF